MVSETKKWVGIIGIIITLSACHKQPAPTQQTRSYRMGFSNLLATKSLDTAIQLLGIWTQRADAAIISEEVPWDSLLNGESAQTYVIDHYQGLVNYYRAKNLKIWIFIDPENGLNRSSDADELVAAGQSIANPPIQLLYRAYVRAMDSLLHPDHMGLALETNLIRGIAPDSVYQGVKQAANAAAKDLKSMDPSLKLSMSVQAEYAWGKFTGGTYLGTSRDFEDFPFIQELGISSYPYIVFNQPADIPLNYYSILTQGKSLPEFVSEGGWTSKSIIGPSGNVLNGSPQLQSIYIRRQSQLLDQAKAIALFQLDFADLNITYLPANLLNEAQPFLFIGLADSSFVRKPALTTWDSLFNKTLLSGN